MERTKAVEVVEAMLDYESQSGRFDAETIEALSTLCGINPREGYQPGDATSEPGREPITLPRGDVERLFEAAATRLEQIDFSPVHEDEANDLRTTVESVEHILGYKR